MKIKSNKKQLFCLVLSVLVTGLSFFHNSASAQQQQVCSAFCLWVVPTPNGDLEYVESIMAEGNSVAEVKQGTACVAQKAKGELPQNARFIVATNWKLSPEWQWTGPWRVLDTMVVWEIEQDIICQPK